MPIIKSAIKRAQVAERNRQRNRSWKSAVRSVRSEVTELVAAVDAKKASEALKQAYATIDKAVSKGILHKNSGARKKSRLAQAVFKLASTTKGKKK